MASGRYNKKDDFTVVIQPTLIQVPTVVCKIVHKFASVWCKTALGEVGVSLP